MLLHGVKVLVNVIVCFPATKMKKNHKMTSSINYLLEYRTFSL